MYLMGPDPASKRIYTANVEAQAWGLIAYHQILYRLCLWNLFKLSFQQLYNCEVTRLKDSIEICVLSAEKAETLQF